MAVAQKDISVSDKINWQISRAGVPDGLYPHFIFFMTFLLWAVLSTEFIRQSGMISISLLMVFTYLYFIMTQAFYRHGFMLAFTLWGLVYVALSYANVLPDAWTIYYNNGYIPYQSYFLFLIYPMICSAKRFWIHALRSGRVDFYMFIILLAMVGHVVWLNANYTFEKPFIIPGLLNKTSLLFFSFAYFALVRYQMASYVLVPIFFLIVAALAINIQTTIGALFLVLLAFSSVNKTMLVLTMISIVGMTIFGYMFLDFFVYNDVNTAFRYILWYDAIEGFLKSYMVGVGFGKEIAANTYLEIGLIERYETIDDIMKAGAHNSFLSMFFRLGLIGGIFFVVFFLRTCWPSNIKDKKLAKLATFAFFIAFMSAYVNLGIESPRAIVGICLLLGFVLACKHISPIKQTRSLLDFTPEKDSLVARYGKYAPG